MLYAVEITWPDGHREYHRESSRLEAERTARMHNGRDDVNGIACAVSCEPQWEPIYPEATS